MDTKEATDFYLNGLKQYNDSAILAEHHLAETNLYSNLIVKNPLPLEFYEDLIELLIRHSNGSNEAKIWAHKIAIGCCGRTHLYLDLGFTERSKISQIFNTHFAALADKNEGNVMRWKKFIYRQFCLESGLPLCPTASCGECPTYTECYSG